MIKPDLIIRSHRKTLCLSISKNGELVVRAPKKLDINYIMNFIKEKEKWILKKQKEILNKSSRNSHITNYNSFLYFGKTYAKQELSGCKEVEITSNNILFPKNLDKLEMIKLVQNFYINTTKEVLKNRVNYFCNLMNLQYSSVSIMNNKTRWGSCSKDGDLKFNLRLTMLPHKVIDYIIIHELSHLIEFNHSTKFYKIIESIMPKYKSAREQLKSYDYVLSLLR